MHSLIKFFCPLLVAIVCPTLHDVTNLSSKPTARVAYVVVYTSTDSNNCNQFLCSLHVAIICDNLTAPTNGEIFFTDGSNFGSAAAYSCDEGFTRTGDLARVCLGEGTWTGSEPSCDGE